MADLVEPETLREKAGEYLQRAGEVLRAAGRVNIVDFGPMLVTAQVDDGGEQHHVKLAAVDGDLTVDCDCPTGHDGTLCPHSTATAIETWHRAPKRQG